MLDMYPAHRDNFSDQRKYYFAAEAVRRGTRDLYGAKEKDPFQVLKDEMYEGVKEVWECEYKNGLTRMRSVMSQATKTSLEICRICRDTVWVGATQRKGVCHFLVKEKRLKGWVRDGKNPARSAHLTDASGIAGASRGYDRYALERPAGGMERTVYLHVLRGRQQPYHE